MIRARTIWTIAGITSTVIAATALAAWLLGRVASDRFGWSQWLLWMPTPAALLAVGLGVAGACRPAYAARPRRRRLAVWGVVGAALALYFLVIEHRFLRWGAGDPGTLTLLHSSLHLGPLANREAYVNRLADVGADLTVLSNRLSGSDIQRFKDRRREPVEDVTLWPFQVITRLPILEARSLVASDGITVAVFRLDATAELGRPITLLAVDLPSDPKRPRYEIALAARRMLESVAAPPPDIVVGDLNMTRGSASVKTLFPVLKHAYDQAGCGYGATFRRGFPLYHLDHTLLADTVQAADYALVDLGIGRHLAQRVELVPAPASQ
ncbi:MAG: exonuclease/endonuclease/phosphatase family protein [Planctomycetota bacterium]|jgi:hypothetical protein